MIYALIIFVELVMCGQKGYMTQQDFLLLVVSILALIDHVRYLRLRSKGGIQ